MSYSFGWWDYVDGPAPAMVNRYTHERVVRIGPLASGLAPADEPWLRFDYVSDDVVYPMAVRWAPHRGDILLDHNRSASLWQQKTGSSKTAPPFGTFVRADDCATDAFWCWPGHLEMFFEYAKTSPGHSWWWDGDSNERYKLPTIYRIGGWSNSQWRDDFVQEDIGNLGWAELYPADDLTRSQAPILGFLSKGFTNFMLKLFNAGRESSCQPVLRHPHLGGSSIPIVKLPATVQQVSPGSSRSIQSAGTKAMR